MAKTLKSDNIEVSAGLILLTSGFGSAANPNITQENNTSVGIYFPAENQIAISTDGVERFKIDNTGLVTANNLNVSGNFSVGTGFNVSSSNININGDLYISGKIIVSNMISGFFSGTAFNSELLSGYSQSSSAIPNTVVLRDINGDGYFSKINITGLDNEVDSSNITQIYVKGGDSFIRKASPAAAATAILNVATGTWNIDVTGAISASGFSSNRTVILAGNVTGLASADFLTGISIPTTIANGAVSSSMLDTILTDRTVGDSANIPIITVNSKGRITSTNLISAGGIISTGSDPTSLTLGQVWYNTTSQALKFYNGQNRTIFWG